MIQLLVARETHNRSDVAALVAAANEDAKIHGRAVLEGQFLARSDVRVYAARFGMRAVGFGVLHVPGDGGAEILRVFIDPPGRKRGMGRALVDALERAAWDEGARHVRARLPASLVDAAAFYQKLGYTLSPASNDEIRVFVKPLQNPKPPGVKDGDGIRYLCRADDIPDPGAKSVMLGRGENAKNIVVAKKDGRLHGYVNSCPHWGTPLEIVPGNLMTRDKKYLFCATHGAKFQLEDGFCVDGPCEGESMKPVTLILENGAVSLDEASYPTDANPRDNGVK
jgi:nitrite reductase/ring-hydroxylating ferredoxin subunit/GNAT superfamily N-acetyltransferase